MNILRRLPLARLLLLCATTVAVGICATALALALAAGPTPAPKPLAQAVHDALSAPPLQGVSASVQLTDHLLEGANLAGAGEAGQLASSPLLAGATGRLWIAADGRARLELQSERGDTEIICDGRTITYYDAGTDQLYRYALPAGERPDRPAGAHLKKGQPPTVAQVEEALAHLRRHVEVSEATPTDVAGQPAYTVRFSPDEAGSLFGGVALSWDAVHGVPLRAAVYSSTGSAPVIELSATDISYGPVPSAVFEFKPPPGAKLHELGAHTGATASHPLAHARLVHPGSLARLNRRLFGSRLARRHSSAHLARAHLVRRQLVEGHLGLARSSRAHGSGHVHVSTVGHGVTQVAVLESRAAPQRAGQSGGSGSAGLPEGLPKLNIDGTQATELATALGTVLSFERSGVSYLLIGSVPAAAIEAVARGL